MCRKTYGYLRNAVRFKNRRLPACLIKTSIDELMIARAAQPHFFQPDCSDNLPSAGTFN